MGLLKKPQARLGIVDLKKYCYLLGPHILLSLLLFAFTSLGLGYRYLWADEIETAERARLILESGFPLVIDQQGTASVNTGGREIEDGNLHRYTPWLQFYVGAIGLRIGQFLDLPQDEAVRLPFVAAHSVAMGILSFALATQLSVPTSLSLAIGAGLGLQSTRIAHNRTARYHALLDFLAALGLLALGGMKRLQKWGSYLLASVLFFSFHAQTLGGACLAGTFAVAAGALLYGQTSRQSRWRLYFASVILPGGISVALLGLLTRPWLQTHWGAMVLTRPRTFFHPPTLLYAFLFAGVWSLILFRKRASPVFWAPALVALTSIVIISVFDFHPFSQIRYYSATALVSLFWPFYTKLEQSQTQRLRPIFASIFVVILLTEFALGRATSRDLYWPLQGLRLVHNDFKMQQMKTQQPLQEALAYIRSHAQPNDPILVDYVPQYVNWYLPGHPVALIPDQKAKTKLNQNRQIWLQTLPFPKWHIWNQRWGSGTWDCLKSCDFSAHEVDLQNATYLLTSGALSRTEKMCIVKSWMTDPLSNSPFKMLTEDAFKPAGAPWGVTLLARPCVDVGKDR